MREDGTFTTVLPVRKWSSMRCSFHPRLPETASSKMRRQSAARSTFLSIPRVQDTRRSVDHAAERKSTLAAIAERFRPERLVGSCGDTLSRLSRHRRADLYARTCAG